MNVVCKTLNSFNTIFTATIVSKPQQMNIHRFLGDMGTIFPSTNNKFVSLDIDPSNF